MDLMQIVEKCTHGDGKNVFLLERCLETHPLEQALKRMCLKSRVLHCQSKVVSVCLLCLDNDGNIFQIVSE